MNEIEITIFHFKNGMEINDAFFDKIPIDEKTSTWSKEKQLTDNLTVILGGGFIRESKFAIQDKYVKFSMKEVNSENIDELAHILFDKLSKIEDVDSLGINKKKIPIKLDDIQTALKEWLESTN